MSKLPPKERMKIPRQVMPAQAPEKRINNFFEVNLGLTEELAKLEASRCLECPHPACVEGCPVNVKIKDFVALVAEGKFLEAAYKIKEDNILPAVCGRVCPQEEQCEAKCVLAKRSQPVAIGNLERFVADYERNLNLKKEQISIPKNEKKVAIIGSGPAGLSCAADLIMAGYDVTVFEALHELGGVLVYGIPEFRLPKEVVKAEIEGLKNFGVKFVTNFVVGLTATLDELREEFDAIFIGVGAGLPYFLNIPGENLNGIYSANEFLTRVNLMKSYKFPDYDTPILDIKDKVVAVFGGGNTAMDAVRTAKRLGAKDAYIIYRRTEQEMPARKEEVHHAKEEQIIFKFLRNPIKFEGDENNFVKKVELQMMELAEPDASGRRKPVPIKGKTEILEIDTAVIAIGNGSNPILVRTAKDLEFNCKGNIVVDENTMQTNLPGVFAGGDIVTGGATVILAMGAGRKAAKNIIEYLQN